jgi:RNA polymerase sigma factor (sigma-70 family)
MSMLGVDVKADSEKNLTAFHPFHRCKKCGHEGPQADFVFYSKEKARVRSCKACRNQKARELYRGIRKPKEPYRLPSERECKLCHEVKPITEFYRCGVAHIRRHSCKVCMALRQREDRKQNPARQAYYSKRAAEYRRNQRALVRKLLYRAGGCDTDAEKVAYVHGYMAGAQVKEAEAVKVEECSDLVYRIAKELGWDKRLSWDDLVQVGYTGLLEAIRRYRPGKASLRTFAAKRIRGAIQDEIRARHPSRMGSMRAGAPALEKAPDALLEGLVSGGSVSPSDASSLLDVSDILQRIEERLGPRTGRLWKLLSEGHNQREIGEEFGVSESRVNQLMRETREEVSRLAQGLL